MLKNALLIIIACCFAPLVLNAQLVNTGQTLFIAKEGLLYIQQDYKHFAGNVLNNGQLALKGDWYNHDSSSPVFDKQSAGEVDFKGADQKISGTAATAFPNVMLSVTGNKTLKINTTVNGVLDLCGSQLLADKFTVSVLNPDAGAIRRTTGFVSTDNKGKLLRVTNSTDSYLFPLGSATGAGTLYRPLSFEPQNYLPNSFAATFVNADPDMDNLSRTKKRPDVKSVYASYYYLLDQASGSSNVNVRFFQNASIEGSFSQLVNWSMYRLWEKAAPSIVTDGNFNDGLNRNLLYTANSLIRQMPVSLAEYEVEKDPLTFFNAFSPDGDGRNDKWIIRNLDLYPDNELTIFNRWGDEVFKTKAYSSEKAWDGSNLGAGTYFYVLHVNVNGSDKAYKGFITMVKKN